MHHDNLMVCVRCDLKCVIHWGILERNHVLNYTANNFNICLMQLHKHVQNVLVQSKFIMTPEHTLEKLTSKKCTELDYEVFLHPPYSSDNNLSRLLQVYMNSKTFVTAEELRIAMNYPIVN